MTRKTPIPRRLPVPHQPDAAERDYLRHLNRYVAAYIAAIKRALEALPELKEAAAAAIPQPRMDGPNIERAIRLMLAKVTKDLEGAFPDKQLITWATRMVGMVNRTAKDNVKRVTETVGIDSEPLMRDRALTPYFQNVVQENVGLIRSIPARDLPRLKDRLVAAIVRDQPHDQIREMIEAHFNVSRNRARSIARDQVSKLNGAIAKYRQQSLGGTRYRWRTNKDGRERPDHARLDGRVFHWDNPPVTNRSTGARNNPGEDFECRCWAEMILEDVVE